MAEKPNLNIVVVGHVDHGKSTLMGRFLYETGAVPDRIIQQYREEAQKKGKATFEFAWVFDRMKEERERGVTIDIYHQEFETDKYHITIIDAPGHKDFIKNMIKGATQADYAILVVAANDGVKEQTKEHALLLKVAGVQKIVVVINKMDTVDYSKERYEEVKQQVENLLKGFGWKPEDVIAYVPASAYYGDNVTKKSDKMPWYDGPTILEAIDMFPLPPDMSDRPLRISVQAVYNIKGVGLVPVGRVYTGRLKSGDKVIVEPSHKEAEVKSIEMFHKQIPEAKAGDNIGFNIKGIEKRDIDRGSMIGHPDNPPTVALEFEAMIFTLPREGGSFPTISVGYTPVIHAHEASIAGRFVELIKKIDPKTGETIEENPQFIKEGEAAIVKIQPLKPMCLEDDAQKFGRLTNIAVRDMGSTIAAGKVLKITKKRE